MMRSGAIAEFEGITAHGDEYRGEPGWYLVDLSGWTDSPDVTQDREDRPAQHGRFPSPAFFRSREVRMGGFHIARTHEEMEHASAHIRGIVTRQIQLTITDMFGTFWVTGTVTRAAYVNQGFASEGTWIVEVECDDPRKYGDERAFPGGEPAVHYGNFPATPRQLVGAGAGGYTITGPGGRVVTVGTAPAAAHEIDFAAGGLFLNGVRQPGVITVYQPWTIPPGLPGVVASISGARSLAQHVTDTFV